MPTWEELSWQERTNVISMDTIEWRTGYLPSGAPAIFVLQGDVKLIELEGDWGKRKHDYLRKEMTLRYPNGIEKEGVYNANF